MRKVKQVIVMRKDLNMRKGKMVAQGSHAVLGLALKYKWRFLLSSFFPGTPIHIWLTEKFRKIVVGIDSEKALIALHCDISATNMMSHRKIPHILIKDAGDTEFNGVPTYTCLAIGPWWSDEIDVFTGDLKLL